MGGSEKIFDVEVVRGVKVRMRDGVELNAKILRPKRAAVGMRFPAVMEYNPYRMQSAKGTGNYRDEIPMVSWYLAERGYVVVHYEVRGTGSSTGYSEMVYSEDERRDGYDMCEWIARQEWCTGAVGMIGISHGAVVQWQVAVQQPPHLKTIIVRSANDDVYTEFTNPGGSIRPWIFEAYGPHMDASNFSPPSEGMVGEKWEEIWKERLEKSVPWSISHIRNIVQGEFWKCKSLSADDSRVKVPVYLIEGWADWYATAELRAFQKLSVPRKVLIGPWGHYYPDAAFPGPRVNGCELYRRWFDYWLKGIENGVMKEPAVTVFVRHWKEPALMYVEDAGEWRNEDAWPPKRVVRTKLYLGGNDQLVSESVATGTASFEYRASAGMTTGRRSGLGSTTPWGLPLDQRGDEEFGPVWTGEPLEKAMEVMGECDVVLHVSSTAKVAYFHVKLCDISPEGVSRLITDGGLLGTHRASHETPVAMTPGEVYELKFPLKHIAYRVEAGHRLRVMVTGADFQNAWPTGERGVHTVHLGVSRVVVPWVVAGSQMLASPELGESSKALPKESEMGRPVYRLVRDLVNETVTCELEPLAGGIWEKWTYHSTWTVSDRDPAVAVIEGTASCTGMHGDKEVCVVAKSRTSSDAENYTHESRVEMTVNGERFFEKTWRDTVPRQWS
ncbi:MAG: CocE/NonD family hydrolase [Phycisphaerales bacterium]|nr:CocE/NonD family hydrolase [Phycisphaerales bacterium]